MDPKPSATTAFERQLAGQAARRREQASAPIERKIAALVRLQRINAQIARQKGRAYREPWQIRAANG